MLESRLECVQQVRRKREWNALLSGVISQVQVARKTTRAVGAWGLSVWPKVMVVKDNRDTELHWLPSTAPEAAEHRSRHWLTFRNARTIATRDSVFAPVAGELSRN